LHLVGILFPQISFIDLWAPQLIVYASGENVKFHRPVRKKKSKGSDCTDSWKLNTLVLKILSALPFLVDQVKTDVCNELKTDNLI